MHPYSHPEPSEDTKSADEAPWFGRSLHDKQNKTKQNKIPCFIDKCTTLVWTISFFPIVLSTIVLSDDFLMVA
jgi:hypothetical protein